MLTSFVEYKIITIFATSKSAGGSPHRSINTLKGLYVACTFVVQAITFLKTRGLTTNTQRGPSRGNERPLPHPLPRREGRDYRDTPNVLLLVVYGVSWSRVNHCPAHFVSYIIHYQILVNGVYSVIICLYVIMSINIKNTPQHVLSVILCLSVILSITIKNTPQHVLSVIICLSVIMSLYIKFSFSMYVSSVSVTYMKSGGCKLR